MTGWINVIAWQASLASASYLTGTIMQGLIVLNNPTYNFERWHSVLLLYAVVAICLLTNTLLARILPQIESTILFVHFMGFFVILIPLVYLGPHKSAREVFQEFNNGGGWPTEGISFFVGLEYSVFAFFGRSQ